MDEDIKKLLKSWDLEQYIPIFAENKITLDSLGLLDAELIKELIAPIGDRARFIKNVNQWNDITQSLQEETCSGVDILNERHRLSQIKDITNVIEDASNNEIVSASSPLSPAAVQQENIHTFILSPSTSTSTIETFIWPNEDSKHTKLRDLLQSSQEGKGLLHMYQENGLLSNNGRRKVCNIIIKHLLEKDITKRVSSSTLLDYAQQITNIFQKENISTYFIPYISNTKLKIRKLAKGKLYDCLQNRKREYREAYGKTKNTGQQSSSVSEILSQDQDPDTSEDITWLKNCSDPFDMVRAKWQNTFNSRRREILENPDKTVANYMNTYPSLKKHTGFHLLVSDFNNLYPDSCEKLMEEFPLYKQKILELTVKKFSRHPDVNTKKFAEECLKLALPSAPAEEVDFFVHADQNARIVGGTQAPEGSVPYMAALSNGLLIRSFLCGGSLIAPRTILTAAHCIDAVFSFGSLSNSLRVTVGTNRWNLGGQSYNLARNVTHQNYVSGTIKNDIGLLITTANVVLSNTVNYVPLSFAEAGAGVVSRVAGWGRIRQGGSLSTMLLELTLSTIDGQRCVEDVARAAIEFNTRAPPVEPHIEICTFHSPGHGTCNGDSGSALVRVDSSQQIGIVSWGFPCARGAPDMFVRVSAYRDWLLTHVV